MDHEVEIINPKSEVPSIKTIHFITLPVELQLQIFSYFTHLELSTTIAPVCKKWWILSKDASLWKEITFTITSERVSNAYRELLFRCPSLHSLKVKSYVSISNIIDCFSSLTQLKVLDLGFSNGLNAAAVHTIVSNCTLIQRLNLEGCSPGVDLSGIQHIATFLVNLKYLNLSHCTGIDDLCIMCIARRCQKLELLNIDGVTRITDVAVHEISTYCRDSLHHLYLDGEDLTDKSMVYLSSCKNLLTLKLSFGEFLTDKTLHALSNLQNLKQLKLRRSPNLTFEGLGMFFLNPRLVLLVDLEIDSLNIDDTGLQNLTKTCNNLCRLALPWCWEVSDFGLKSIVENCKMLNYLDLLGLYQLTGAPLIHVPSKLPRLLYLNLEQCNNIIDVIVKDLVRKMPLLRVHNYYGDQFTDSEGE